LRSLEALVFTVLVHLGGLASVQIRASISSCAAVPRVWLLQAVREATTEPRRALLAPLFFFFLFFLFFLCGYSTVVAAGRLGGLPSPAGYQASR
jgi:hypothetical protein